MLGQGNDQRDFCVEEYRGMWIGVKLPCYATILQFPSSSSVGFHFFCGCGDVLAALISSPARLSNPSQHTQIPT